MKIFLLSMVFLITLRLAAQPHTEVVHQYSEVVQDSFLVFITIPATMDSMQTNKVCYYLDANLNSGRALRGQLSRNAPQNTIFVGIGHIGNYHVKRRRDFIPPSPGKVAPQPNFEQADQFYRYLTEQLMPYINHRYHVDSTKNSLLGHSLGGLFTYYCLFRNEGKFTNYFALSPSLWIQDYYIYHHDQLGEGITQPYFLYSTAGSMETMNHILNGAKEAEHYFSQQQYGHLSYTFKVYPGATHNSAVAPALQDILMNYLNDKD